MVISVAIAVVAMTIWFFFFAGSSLPSGSDLRAHRCLCNA